MPLSPGLSAEIEVKVEDADTALALGSGDLAVLGTPRIVALFEQATVRAVADHMPDGQTSVGVEVAVQHRSPSLPGARIVIVAELVDVTDTRLRFEVAAHDAGELVADGTIVRVVVDRERLLRRAARPS